MDQGKIGVRYAKAYYSLGKDKNLLDEFYSNVQELSQLLKNVEEFNEFINSPILKPSKKIEITEKMFSGRIHTITLDFIKLIIKHKRETYLRDILLYFNDLYREEKRIKSAVLTSAYTLEPELKDRIVNIIKERYKATVEMEEKVNENLIGGFILKIDDMQFDASVLAQLSNIKRELENTGV